MRHENHFFSLPGQPFTFTASPGGKLQFVTMFVQSNDLFFALRNGTAASRCSMPAAMHGKVTSLVALFDAGTEVNQAPGAGSGQERRGEPSPTLEWPN